MSFIPRTVFSWYSFIVLFVLGVPLFGQPADTCLICHGRDSLSVTKGGRVHSLFVDRARLSESVHSSLACVDCHKGLNPGKFPHADVIKPVQCQTCHKISEFDSSVHGNPSGTAGVKREFIAGCTSCHGTHDIRSLKDPKSRTNRINISHTCSPCHKKEDEEYITSAHGVALASGGSRSPSCIDCHGSHNIESIKNKMSPLFKTREADLCLKCHLDNPEIIKLVGVSAGFIASYKQSVHGIALASGNGSSATCSDCHGIHDLKKPSDPASKVSRWNIAETCSQCHTETAKVYDDSVHGKALSMGNADAPTCTDCHGEHQIYASGDPRSPLAPKNLSERICATCHNSVQLNAKYGMPTERFNSFSDSYHGLASRAGSVAVANCASCHGIHDIKPSSDPTSTINKANLAKTCGRCHPGANNNFTRGAVHVIKRPESQATILDWIRIIYIGLIVIVIGGMLLHNLLDFVKKTRYGLAVRRGEKIPEHYGNAQYVRMTLNERIQHIVMLVSFLLLAVTGFMLKYPDSWWVAPIRQLSDRFFEVRRVTHRIAGVVMIAISFYHLVCICVTSRGRQFVRDMSPRWMDVTGAWKNLLYNAGLSRKRPRFDRFGYVEKVEYWALIWGVLIMSLTGVILWFENYFIGLFTKLGWDIARTIHFYEACLASLAILVWHFYFVIFNPSIYPMNTAWITGKISEEEMAEEHPLELERIQKQESGDF